MWEQQRAGTGCCVRLPCLAADRLAVRAACVSVQALDTTPHPGCNVDANTYLNCNHTITIISGAPGCSQGISNETAPDDMLITSSLTYGFGLLTVVNETHLYWSWSSTSDATAGSNSSKGGDAAAADYSDFAWVVQMFAP